MAKDKRKENIESHKWAPGESGNPKGRPKNQNSLTHLLRQAGEEEDATWNGQKMSRNEALAHRMWTLALQGNEQIAKYLYDRIDGKPTQEIKVASDIDINAPIYFHIGARIEEVDPEQAEDEDEDEENA